MTVLLKDNPVIGKAHKVYQDFTANDELMDMAEAREKWRKDVNTRLHHAKSEGREEGKLEDAEKMLTKDYPISDIAEITGLSEDQIRNLKTKTDEN